MKPRVVMHTFNLSTSEAETGRSFHEFEDSLVYIGSYRPGRVTLLDIVTKKKKKICSEDKHAINGRDIEIM